MAARKVKKKNLIICFNGRISTKERKQNNSDNLCHDCYQVCMHNVSILIKKEKKNNL